MKIGLTEVTSKYHGTALLEHATKLGLTGVEPMIGTVDSPYLTWSDEQFNEFNKKSNELQVSAPSTAVAIFNGFPGLVDPTLKADAIKLIEQSLLFSAKLHAENMLLCTFFESKPDSKEKEDNFLEILERVMPLAETLNVKIAIESPLNAKQLAYEVNHINSSHLGIYYDVGNAIWLGYDPVTELNALGSMIFDVHIKDTLENLGDSRLGSGKVDLKGCTNVLKNMQYAGWVMLETPGGDDELLQEDIRVLKSLI